MTIRKKVFLLALFILGVISFISLGFLGNMESVDSSSDEKGDKISFIPKSVPAGSKSKYDMALTMNEEGTFHLESTFYHSF
ncbi:hypothetical protein [Priestia megaterium]|jgi:hypothetical protein|uniref:hypothetical protein n=1 Tax=Priestia megaterium TaxID=1404 RepID=UPI00203D7A44|nr:hypothetical protein [Priestia megaterium]MCM3194898.1 hypothetical protein [Priestia megaterium]